MTTLNKSKVAQEVNVLHEAFTACGKLQDMVQIEIKECPKSGRHLGEQSPRSGDLYRLRVVESELAILRAKTLHVAGLLLAL